MHQPSPEWSLSIPPPLLAVDFCRKPGDDLSTLLARRTVVPAEAAAKEARDMSTYRSAARELECRVMTLHVRPSAAKRGLDVNIWLYGVSQVVDWHAAAVGLLDFHA
jgi:hypothetical protein